MQKRNFFGIAAILVLLFAFIGCSQPADDVNHLINKLDAPTNLKAEAYDGVIITHWDPVINAKGYDVYRRNTKTNVTVKLATATTNLYYIDAVDWNNQLIDKQDYQYTIVSLSGKNNVDTGVPGGTEMIVQNSASKIIKKAQIPALSAYTVKLTDADVSLESAGGKVFVKVTNQPNQAYSIGYTIGAASFVSEFANTSTSADGDWHYPIREASFPVVGGKNTVKVVSAFVGGINYYTQGASVLKVTDDLPAGWNWLGDGSLFAFAANRQEGRVQLLWHGIPGADGYKIYRAEVSNDKTNLANISTGDSISGLKVISDWDEVKVSSDSVDIPASGLNPAYTQFSAYDPLSKDTGYYLYTIIATAENGGSGAGFALASPHKLGDIDYDDDYNGLIGTFAIAAGSDAKTRQFLWDADTSLTYTLQYAPVTAPNGGSASATNYALSGAYAAIDVKAADILEGKAVVTKTFTDAETGSNYIIKLTASKNGINSATAYAFLTDGAFGTTVKFNLSQDTGAEYQNFKTVNLVLSDNGTFREKDYAFKLYRRVITEKKVTAFAEVTLPAAAATYKSDAKPNSWTFQDSGLDPALTYEYKIETTIPSEPVSSGVPLNVVTNVRTNGYNSVIAGISGSWSKLAVDFDDSDPAKKGTIPANSIKLSGNRNLVGLTVTLSYPLATPTATAAYATTTGTIGYAASKTDSPDEWLYLTVAKPANAATGSATFTVIGYDNTLGVNSIDLLTGISTGDVVAVAFGVTD